MTAKRKSTVKTKQQQQQQQHWLKRKLTAKQTNRDRIEGNVTSNDEKLVENSSSSNVIGRVHRDAKTRTPLAVSSGADQLARFRSKGLAESIRTRRRGLTPLTPRSLVYNDVISPRQPMSARDKRIPVSLRSTMKSTNSKLV